MPGCVDDCKKGAGFRWAKLLQKSSICHQREVCHFIWKIKFMLCYAMT